MVLRDKYLTLLTAGFNTSPSEESYTDQTQCGELERLWS